MFFCSSRFFCFNLSAHLLSSFKCLTDLIQKRHLKSKIALWNTIFVCTVRWLTESRNWKLRVASKIFNILRRSKEQNEKKRRKPENQFNWISIISSFSLCFTQKQSNWKTINNNHFIPKIETIRTILRCFY